MKKLTIMAMLLVTSLCLSCKHTAVTRKTASLRFDGVTSVKFSGEVWGYEEFAKKNDLELKIEPGSESTDPIKSVLSGADDFGCTSAEKFLVADEHGDDLVMVGVINQLSPTVFISKKEKKILTPRDWVGKRVGVLPGVATDSVYLSLLRKLDVTNSQFTELKVPLDLETFIAGSYDVRPALAYDEPVSLELQHVPYNMIEPKDYGINYVGRVYFARRKFINDNPELVQKFVNSMADGWNASMARPEAAIARLKEYDPGTEITRDLASLKQAKPYFVDGDGKMLTFNYKFWNDTTDELNELGIVRHTAYQNFVDDSFINRYYAANK